MPLHRGGDTCKLLGVLGGDILGLRRIDIEVEEQGRFVREDLRIAVGALGLEMSFPRSQSGREEPRAAVVAEDLALQRLGLEQDRG